MKNKSLLFRFLVFRIKRIKSQEFSKKLCLFSIFVMLVSICLSAILSIIGRETLTEVTVAVITTCGGYLCTYGIKSAFEKNSRNKYGVDEKGVPWGSDSQNNVDEESEETYG